MKIYIGGSLFTTKQIKQRLEEEKLIRENIEGVEIYNPISNDDINDKTKEPTSRDIFMQDTNEIISSNIIAADLDDEDTGLAMELGVAYGLNYMLDRLEELKKDPENLADNLEKLINEIPKKTVLATCSDIRQDTNNEKGIYKSWGINQYLIGGVEEMGSIHKDFNSLINEIKSK